MYHVIFFCFCHLFGCFCVYIYELFFCLVLDTLHEIQEAEEEAASGKPARRSQPTYKHKDVSDNTVLLCYYYVTIMLQLCYYDVSCFSVSLCAASNQ